MKNFRMLSLLTAIASIFLLVNQSFAATVEGELCLEGTSSITGDTHLTTLSYTLQTGRNHLLVYGSSHYIIDEDHQDRIAVHGSGIFYENKWELSLVGIDNQRDFGANVLTTTNNHYWIEDIANLTGTYSYEANTFVEGISQGAAQFDNGTVRVLPIGDCD